jgi:hypothetical protein
LLPVAADEAKGDTKNMAIVPAGNQGEIDVCAN